MTLRIRLADAADAAACREIYRPVIEETATSFETEVPSQVEMAARITTTTRTHPWLVGVDGDGRVTGYAYGIVHRARAAYRWSAEVSAYVATDARRTGTGKALYSRLFDCLRLQGFCNAFAGITLPNPASVAFHELMGFRPIGVFPGIGYKMEQWHDVGWWSLRLIETDSPTEPRPLADCRDDIERLLASDVAATDSGD